MTLSALLPPELAERTLAVNDHALAKEGDFVLYWLRTAQRLHDNPALLAAQVLAKDLGKPLLIYQGLDERYPFASDRHHLFILEGARDVAAEAAQRGLSFAFHLARKGDRGAHLRTLAAAACAVVTELFPWRPIARWTEALAPHCQGPLLAVDTACLVPMPQTRAQDTQRAFRFRDRYQTRRDEALLVPWTDPEPHAGPHALPFTPLDLPSACLTDRLAACAIDHGVGPVAAYPGGQSAGYARWLGFKAAGLRTYHRRRNNPLEAGGVSGLSPYLHYGQISPFRLAREAAALGGPGAEKYLDELLIWREMAWAFCFHEPRHDTVQALPAWAREALAERPSPTPTALKSLEALRQGRSGEPLWDAAQRALLRQGMLHNNLRMSWGKQVLPWSPDGASALERLLDLNHRYALDGRDPSSYGGILWCLGAFDRPFAPPTEGFGELRPRTTAEHRERLNPEAFAALAAAPSTPAPPRVAIVGAGLAGLACGQALDEHGWPVMLFDKGRRPGGRLATRESRGHAHTFNHGAEAFHGNDRRFQETLLRWAGAGWVQPTAHGWAIQPRAAALPEALAQTLKPRCGIRITRLRWEAEQWHLESEAGPDFGPFDALVLTLPPPQLAELLGASALPTEALGSLRTAAAANQGEGAWALMAVVKATPKAQQTAAEGDWPGTLRFGPVDAGGKQALTAILPATNTDVDLEAPQEAFLSHWRPKLETALRQALDPDALTAHRWRYARFGAPTAAPTWYPALRLALAGDGYALDDEDGDRSGIEAAFLGGRAAAGRLLRDPRWLGERTGTAAPAPTGHGAAQASLF